MRRGTTMMSMIAAAGVGAAAATMMSRNRNQVANMTKSMFKGSLNNMDETGSNSNKYE